MRVTKVAVLTALAATAAFGQQWEFGAVGGVGLPNNVSATGAAGNATAGFSTGFVAGAFAGENLYRHLTGEFRYEYMQNDMRLSASGQSATFAGAAHALHYDLLFHSNRGEARTQFFAAVGGGVKAFFGTGTEQAYQPLSQFGYFTKTHDIKPMLSAGAGFTYRLSERLVLRAEVRDFMTAFPTAVLTPAQGMKYGNILSQFVPMIGIEYSR